MKQIVVVFFLFFASVFSFAQKTDYPLNKNGIYKIPGKIGITTIQVEDEKVRIKML